MATPAQVLSNRQNSLLSTGPVTPAGKEISARNSRKHGLTSRQIVLPGEDAEEYDALRESLLHDYAPANETERTLVEEIAAGSWRLARARRHEAAILRKLLGDGCGNADEAFAELFVEKPKEVARLLRYVTSIERSYYRALNMLQKLQKERIKQEQETSILRAFASTAAARRPVNGFVSQNVSDVDSAARGAERTLAAPTPESVANGAHANSVAA